MAAALDPPRDPLRGALQGVRVLDFSHVIAGPFATFYLAQMGAQVLKVERPGRGDVMRRTESGARAFTALNAGKQMREIDFDAPAGQAELQYQQGARQALIAQAAAEDEAAIKRAEAATRRVLGWTDAAKRGCAELGRTGDRQCEEQLLKDAATYSIAKEGHEGVIISVGAPVSVAVDPNARRTASE